MRGSKHALKQVAKALSRGQKVMSTKKAAGLTATRDNACPNYRTPLFHKVKTGFVRIGAILLTILRGLA